MDYSSSSALTRCGPPRESIIVPRAVLDGLLTALHIQLCHPSGHQLKSVVKRYNAVDRTTRGCHVCASLRQTPQVRIEQSSNLPPDAVGVAFAADVIKRSRQLILVRRECISSFTLSLLLGDEGHVSLRNGLIQLCIQMRPLDGPLALIRTDPVPGFKAIVDDAFLARHRITLEVGQPKNRNKNPVGEKVVLELEQELLRQDPLGGPVTDLALATATAPLNSRIRSCGLSAREIWTQRDQFSNKQIPLPRLRPHCRTKQAKAS